MNRASRILVVFLLCFSMVTLAHAASKFQEGDSGPDITQIQSRLIGLGYKINSADGAFGPMTTAAVKAFQKDKGLEVDGVVGSATYQALIGRDIPVSRDGSTIAMRRIIQTALRYRGVPFRFGGTTPDGFDCSGFVRYVFASGGVSLPRMADEQYAIGQPVAVNRLQPGDTVYFSTYTSGVSHVGIYVGDGNFISATSSRGVTIDSLNSGYWGPRYIGARRMF